MNFKKTIKGIVALGSASILMGSTLVAGAMDLGNYPSPFTEDGHFDGSIVVGANAATADVIGAVDVAAGLQADNVREEIISIEGIGDISISVSDGIALESRGVKLNLGDVISASRSRYDFDSLPELLSESEIVDDTGTNGDIEFSERLRLPTDGMNITFGNVEVDDEDIVSEFIYFFGENEINLTIDFDDEVNFLEYDESEEIVILGRPYVIAEQDDDSELVLYGSTQEAALELGESKTFTIGGEDVTIELVGGTTDSVVLDVDGRRRSRGIGDTIRVHGEEIRVRDIMYSDIGDRTFIIVDLMLGSDELILSGGEIELNGDDIDGVGYYIDEPGTITGFDSVNDLVFTFDFVEIMEDFYDFEETKLLPNERISDPVFGQITLAFDGLKGEFESGDYVNFEIRSDDLLRIDFDNYDGDSVRIEPIKADDNVHKLNNFLLTNDINLTDDSMFSRGDKFLHNEYVGGGEYLTRLFEIRSRSSSVGNDDEVIIRNVITGRERTYEAGDYFYGDDMDLVNFGSEIIANTIHTRDGMEIQINQDNLDDSDDVVITLVEEDMDSIELNLSVDDGELEFDLIDIETYSWEDDDDIGYGLTEHGTYFIVDEDDNHRIELYYPGEDAREFAAALGNSDVEISISHGEETEYTYDQVVRIGSGMAYLDTEINIDNRDRNIISVGGPAANDVSADLLGEYTGPEGFGEGQAFIKLIEHGDYVAMVVAGYEAQDTRHASKVLADHMDYDLSGEEVLITGTSMADLEISPVE